MLLLLDLLYFSEVPQTSPSALFWREGGREGGSDKSTNKFNHYYAYYETVIGRQLTKPYLV